MLFYNKYYRNLRTTVSLGLTYFICLNAYSSPPSILQTQTQLKKLDVQMNKLKERLTSAHDKREFLHQELAATEKKMGTGAHQLKELQELITLKESHITELKDKLGKANSQLRTQQQLLARHVRARYQIGDYQPLKWLINQNHPHQFSQIITYYHYLIQSRQRLMDQIDETRKDLKKPIENLSTS